MRNGQSEPASYRIYAVQDFAFFLIKRQYELPPVFGGGTTRDAFARTKARKLDVEKAKRCEVESTSK